jgi:hypothetical protein
MEVQPDIQQRSALIKQAVWEPARLPSGHRTRGLQLIQRSDALVSTARALTHLHLLLVMSSRVSTSADYVRRRVMCGVALPYARLVDPCRAVTW